MSAYPRACSEGVVCEEVGDELVVYVQATQTAHALAGDAASVWRCCDGERSIGEIARLVGLDVALVARAVEQLSVAGLIERPEGISRRALHKRAAEFGAAALSAPLIYSIAIPAAAAAASGICANLALSATGNGEFGQIPNTMRYFDDFGQVDSASATFRVTNNGPGTFGPLTFGFSNDPVGGFAVRSNGCNGGSLASGASCTFDVSFSVLFARCSGSEGDFRLAVVTVSGIGAACLNLRVGAECPV